jgi:hypothetical protein
MVPEKACALDAGGHRFSEKDMRKRTSLERIPAQLDRDAL